MRRRRSIHRMMMMIIMMRRRKWRRRRRGRDERGIYVGWGSGMRFSCSGFILHFFPYLVIPDLQGLEATKAKHLSALF